MGTDNSISSRKSGHTEIRIMKALVFAYILAGIVIAGLNQGYAPTAPEHIAQLIDAIWHGYENWVKTLFLAAGAILTLRIMGKQKAGKLRRKNLFGFLIIAAVIHIAVPFFTGNSEIYLFTMPLPWNSLPLQSAAPSSPFYLSRAEYWGVSGLSFVFLFHLVFTGVIIIGTLLVGRRWQCSTLCMFNGCIAEVFSPAFPVFGKKKPLSSLHLKRLAVLRWVFFSLGWFFSLYWITFLLNMHSGQWMNELAQIEIMKYLFPELLAAMAFWLFMSGRGYCFYCPAGTMTAFVGKWVGQRIRTNLTSCIDCSKCSQICPMQIDIAGPA